MVLIEVIKYFNVGLYDVRILPLKCSSTVSSVVIRVTYSLDIVD